MTSSISDRGRSNDSPTPVPPQPEPGYRILKPGQVVPFISERGSRVLALWSGGSKDLRGVSEAFRTLAVAHRKRGAEFEVGFADTTDWPDAAWEEVLGDLENTSGLSRPRDPIRDADEFGVWQLKVGVPWTPCVVLYRDGRRLQDMTHSMAGRTGLKLEEAVAEFETVLFGPDE
jgi:hypothetical protein